MKKIMSLLLFIVLPAAIAIGQSKGTPVFISATGGYSAYRIPAIIRLPGGKLLAFAEGRVNNAADFGNVDIVMKSSTDNGRSWSDQQVIADNDSLQAGNPAPVVDLYDPAYPAGRIFLFYNTGNVPESMRRRGIGSREVWYKTSVDGGWTWSAAVNITSGVKQQGWRSYANTPGHTLQFTSGKYKGRIYVAANHSSGPPQQHYEDYQAHGFYTDDHGKTFHLSDDIQLEGSNEATATQLEGDRLMMNIRNQKGQPRCRIVAISKDGGVHWDMTYYDPQLPDPVCEGSILQAGRKKHSAILAFSNNADTTRRDHLTLYISFNSGKSWKKQYLISRSEAGSKGTFTGYSDLVKTSRHTIGILYEKNNYREIVFTQVNWAK